MVEDVLRPQLHILARAVIRRDDKILLAQAQGAHNTFLPGGHLEPGESLPVCLVRELREQLGPEAQVGAYLGVVEHSYGDTTSHYELNHLFETSLPTLADGVSTVNSREAHLTFFWAGRSDLAQHQLEPYPLRELLKTPIPSALWASALMTSP